MKLRNVKGGRLEELKNLKLVLAAAIDGYSDPKALPQLALDGFSLVAENDTLGLYLREQYACIRVLDKATGYVWGSFREDEPEDLNETWARFGNSVVSLECIDSTGMTKKAAAGQDEASRRYTWLDDGFTCAVDFGEEINIAVTVSVRLGENRLLFSVHPRGGRVFHP